MAEVADWNPVDDSNNGAPPVGWPEGMVPSAVNNAARAMQGALRREHDRIVAGTLSLPYLPLAGGTVTGNLAVNGTGGIALGATQLQNVSNGLQVTNASGGQLITRGPGAGLDFGSRDQTSASWLWYANANVARLGPVGGGDLVTVNAAGNMAVAGSVNATLYGIDNHPVIDSSGTTILFYDGAGQVSLSLAPSDTFYTADVHHFQNNAGTERASLDSGGTLRVTNLVEAGSFHAIGNANVDATLTAGNLTATGTVTGGYITSTGDVHANNAVTAPSITASGTLQGSYIHSTGTVDGTNINASGTVFAAAVSATGQVGGGSLATPGNATINGTCTAAQLTSTGNANIAGTCTAANFVGNFAGGGGNTITGGTVNSTTVNNSGTITTANLTASSNVTAAGTVTGNSMVCGSGVFQNTGPSNLIGQTSFGPSGSWARIDSSGTYNVSGSWLTFSDRAVKNGVTPYTAGLDAINQLEPVSYTYTSEIEQTPVTRYGLVAQDVAPIVPEMVGSGVTPGGTTMATLNGGHTMWLLINAVKELSVKVSSLEAQLAAAGGV